MSRHNKTGPEAIEREYRRAEALELRKQGFSYREIARQLGVSLDTAHTDVKEAMAAIAREPAETVVELELARYDEIQQKLRTAILEAGDLDRVTQWIQVSNQRAKILGLYHKAVLDLNKDNSTLADAQIWIAAMRGTPTDGEV